MKLRSTSLLYRFANRSRLEGCPPMTTGRQVVGHALLSALISVCAILGFCSIAMQVGVGTFLLIDFPTSATNEEVLYRELPLGALFLVAGACALRLAGLALVRVIALSMWPILIGTIFALLSVYAGIATLWLMDKPLSTEMADILRKELPIGATIVAVVAAVWWSLYLVGDRIEVDLTE